MSSPITVNIRFVGSLTADYKEHVCQALIGMSKPSWLRISHIRSNSTGHHIRVVGKVKDEPSALVMTRLIEHDREAIPCGDGLIHISSKAFKKAYPMPI